MVSWAENIYDNFYSIINFIKGDTDKNGYMGIWYLAK